MNTTKKTIQNATVGQLEDLLAELSEVHTSEAAGLMHQVEKRLQELAEIA